MKYRFVSILLIFMCCSALRAQEDLSTKSKKAERYYWDAVAMLQIRQYYDAKSLLLDALNKDDEFYEAHYRLAGIYKFEKDYIKALEHYQKTLEFNPKDNYRVGSYFYLGEVYFNLDEYEKSLDYLNKYLKERPEKREDEKVKTLLENAKFAADKKKTPIQFDPQPLGNNVNKYPLQYFPVLTVDKQELYFTRRKGVTPQYDEDIVVCKKNKTGGWSEPVSISDNINTRFNEGTCTISADGRMLIFTSCFGRKVVGSCDLFMSMKEGDDWSEPENLGEIVNSKAWESQASLSADGRTLYFVSDRGGGYGGRDIWMTTRDVNNEWTKPVNLGPKINTPKEEVSPFIHANGLTLYFASNGRLGFGNFDIYYTEFGESGWDMPENLGYPINNSNDQVSLFITGDGKTGYYSDEITVETARVKSRIFTFDIPDEIQVKYKTNYVYGRIFDAKTKKTLKAKIELFDLNKNELKFQVQSDYITGQYKMVLTEGADYGLYVNKPNYLFQSLSFNYSEDSNPEPINIDVYLDPIEPGKKTTLKNIFFDFDKYEIKEKSEVELQKVVQFMQDNPLVKIEIEGHTDDKGSEEYNMDLSLKRAKAVYDYLINAGVSEERLSYRGYGQATPVVPNDSEENRSRNRRIEFRVVE